MESMHADESERAAQVDEQPEANLIALRSKLANAAEFGLIVDIFREWDDDQNGTISRTEFRKALPVLGIAIENHQADSLFALFDTDGSGAVDYRELHEKLCIDNADLRRKKKNTSSSSWGT